MGNCFFWFIITGGVTILGRSIITATPKINHLSFSEQDINLFSWKTWESDHLPHFDPKTQWVIIRDQIHNMKMEKLNENKKLHRHKKASWTQNSYIKKQNATWKQHMKATNIKITTINIKMLERWFYENKQLHFKNRILTHVK